jgi:hypothetical protein
MKLSTKIFLTKLNKDIFAISAISFVILFFMELIKPKFVIAYINLNYILLLSLLSGIFIIFFDGDSGQGDLSEAEDTAVKQKEVSFFTLLFLSIVTFAFIMIFTWDLGVWGFLVSLVGGLVVFLLELALL